MPLSLPMRGLVAVGGAIFAATVAGCSSNTPAPTPPVSTPATSASASSSGSSTSSASSSSSSTSSSSSSSSGSGTSTGTAGSDCTINTAKADVVNAPGGAAAGHVELQVKVTNGSSSPCTLKGYPGVSLVYGTQGAQLGAPAARVAGSETAITLAPGKSAVAALSLAEAGNYPNCGLTAAMGFRIYLPNDTAAQFVPQKQNGCTDTSVVLMQIKPFAAS